MNQLIYLCKNFGQVTINENGKKVVYVWSKENNKPIKKDELENNKKIKKN